MGRSLFVLISRLLFVVDIQNVQKFSDYSVLEKHVHGNFASNIIWTVLIALSVVVASILSYQSSVVASPDHSAQGTGLHVFALVGGFSVLVAALVAIIIGALRGRYYGLNWLVFSIISATILYWLGLYGGFQQGYLHWGAVPWSSEAFIFSTIITCGFCSLVASSVAIVSRFRYPPKAQFIILVCIVLMLLCLSLVPVSLRQYLQEKSLHHPFKGFATTFTHVSLYVFSTLLVLIPFWKISRRAGINPSLSLLSAIPIVGPVVVSVVLGFSRWKK